MDILTILWLAAAVVHLSEGDGPRTTFGHMAATLGSPSLTFQGSSGGAMKLQQPFLLPWPAVPGTKIPYTMIKQVQPVFTQGKAQVRKSWHSPRRVCNGRIGPLTSKGRPGRRDVDFRRSGRFIQSTQ